MEDMSVCPEHDSISWRRSTLPDSTGLVLSASPKGKGPRKEPGRWTRRLQGMGVFDVCKVGVSRLH